VARVLSIASLIVPPYFKKCGNCHGTNVTISLACDVYCNVCRLKLAIQKLGFLCGSIATNNELVLLIIKGKWLEAIVHMIKFGFLDLSHPKQV